MQDRYEWRECMGHSLGDEPLTLIRCTVVDCHSYMKPLKGGSPSVGEPTTYNLKGIKGKISVFLFFLMLCFSFTVAPFMA